MANQPASLRSLLLPASTRRGFLGLAGATAAFSALAQLRVLPAAAACSGAQPSGDRFFDDAETEILTQLMQRMVETGLPDAPQVRDTRAVATVDAVCRGLDPAVSGLLPLALLLVEWGPLLFDLRFARFTTLGSRRAGRLASLLDDLAAGAAPHGVPGPAQPLLPGLVQPARDLEPDRLPGPPAPPRGRRPGAGMIEPLLARGGDLVTRADVCVIGSGAGGAVAAAELAAAGRDVVVLEQGEHWTSRDFTQREDEMLPRLFEEAGMRQTVDGGITILQGRCVGGSTVHNLCYAFRTPPAILRMWREEHALPELTEAALAESFARVEANLRVKPIREDEVNTLNRLLRVGRGAARLLGLRDQAQPRELREGRLLPARLQLRRQAVDARHLRPARQRGRRARLRECARRADRGAALGPAPRARPRRRRRGPERGDRSRWRRASSCWRRAPWPRRTCCCAAAWAAPRSGATCTCTRR